MFYLLAPAIAFVLAYADILERIKPQNSYALRCPMCIGFWTSLCLSFTSYAIGPWWVCAFVGSFLSHVMDKALEL